MGGFGSGRPRTRTGGTVESVRALEISKLYHSGALLDGRSCNWIWSYGGNETARIGLSLRADTLRLSYRFRCSGGEWEPIEQAVPIVWRPCRFGGARPYFRCRGIVNGHECLRTVTRLFGSDKYFLCRHCYRLSYGCQHEDRWDRALRRANKIRMKLGGEPGTCSAFAERPKGMRYRTYDRLREQACQSEGLAEERLEILVARLLKVDRNLSRQTKGKKGQFWR